MPATKDRNLPDGLVYLPAYFGRAEQVRLLAAVRNAIAVAPLFTPRMPRSGRPFSVAMTNCGALGWVSDKTGGYRYQETHPETGAHWPAMPGQLGPLWEKHSGYSAPAEACLVNYYGPKARIGLHQDADELDFSAPVISVSLGDEARFRVGGLARRDPTFSFPLQSGDVVILGGAARRIFHGVDRILPGTSDLLEEGGRFNLTLRRVTPAI